MRTFCRPLLPFAGTPCRRSVVFPKTVLRTTSDWTTNKEVLPTMYPWCLHETWVTLSGPNCSIHGYCGGSQKDNQARPHICLWGPPAEGPRGGRAASRGACGKPQKTLQSTDRLYKAPKDNRKPQQTSLSPRKTIETFEILGKNQKRLDKYPK